MSTITTLQMWRDPGYTDGCMEVPPLNASLSNPDVTYSDLNPSKDRLFSEIRVPGDFESLYDMCYLRAVYQMNNGDNVILYGWIDSVTVQSDTADYPITVISWHVDYWRTFASRASYGSGMVTRRPVSGAMPPQHYPHRYLQYSTATNLFNNPANSPWYIIVCYNYVTGSGTTTLEYGVIPASTGVGTTYYMSDGTDTVVCPTINALVTGTIDESLGLSPEQINGVWVSPIPINTVSGSGTSSDPFTTATNRFCDVPGDATYRMFFARPAEQDMQSISVSAETTDTEIYTIVGFRGEIELVLPWGIAVDGLTAYLMVSATSAELVIFASATFNNIRKAYVEGTLVSIPLPSADVSENAWSEYVYSGAQEIASRQLQLNAQANLVSGLTGSINQATTGAIIGGASAGLSGAGVGALVSAGASVLTTAAQYVYESGSYADQMMDINDYEASKQVSSILITGTGMGIFGTNFPSPALVRYTYDDYSLTQRANDLSIYGCTVSEPTESCQSLIEAGGPLRINNLIVGGDIPAPAKTYLRERFSKGVILK